jgi:insulysin
LRKVETRGVLGAQFIVQSDKRSCEYLVQQENNFLVNMREEMKNLSDEEFETNRGAILTKIQEKDVNLLQVASRMWGEIASHSYRFNLQNEKIDALKEVTKA